MFTAAPNAKPVEGHFPLLVISHATPTDRFAYHGLASILAREGFIVAAPTHTRDCMHNMSNLFTWNQLLYRVKEISSTIDAVLGDELLKNMTDPDRIGVIGFGSGGSAALLLGGALPNCDGWLPFQKQAHANDPYLSTLARNRIDALCAKLPLTRSLANTRVKAMAVIAPAYGMLFNAASFRYLYPPILLVCAGRDIFNAAPLHCGAIARLLDDKAKLLDLPMADTGAFITACPETMAKDLPELCNSVSRDQRAEIHSQLYNAVLAFFRHYLVVSANLPKIPEPPDLTPPVPAQADSAPKKSQRRQRKNRN